MFNTLILFVQGIIVGFGAIMPGISGGTLCAAFGLYYPIMSILSDYRNIRIYGYKVFIFGIGGLCGFIGLSSLGNYLLDHYSMIMIYLFSGLILGTIPSLYKEANSGKKDILCFICMLIGFIFICIVLYSIKNISDYMLNTDFSGYFISGILWGLSFIIPGLSSSGLLLYFGIYDSMLEGISRLDMNVVIPLVLGLLLCMILLSHIVSYMYKKYHSYISYTIIGIVLANAFMLIPINTISYNDIIFMVLGLILSYFLTEFTNHFND